MTNVKNYEGAQKEKNLGKMRACKNENYDNVTQTFDIFLINLDKSRLPSCVKGVISQTYVHFVMTEWTMWQL